MSRRSPRPGGSSGRTSSRGRVSWLNALVRRPTGAFGVAVILVVVVAAVVSLLWTPYPLLASDVGARWQGPSLAHPLGTDHIGRDTASWLLAGARTTVIVATFSTLVAGVVGISLALVGAVAPRWVAEPVIVAVDILIAFPVLLIAMLFAAGWGGSLLVVVLAVGVGFGVSIARVTRAEIVRVLGSDVLLAARAAGAGPWWNLRRHVLPGISQVLVVQLSLAAAVSILAEAGLSYLGYGAPSGTPSWGRLLASSQQYITTQPSAVLWPGLAISIATLGFTLFGDALREALDPRLRVSRIAGEPGPVHLAVDGSPWLDRASIETTTGARS